MRTSTVCGFLAALFFAAAPSLAVSAEPDIPPAQEQIEVVEVIDIDMKEARQNLRDNKDIVLLDVRRPDEYAVGYISGAKLLTLEPVDEISPNITRLYPDKNTEIYVYCKGGGRSKKAAALLTKIGYANVKNLGGYDQWLFEKNLPPAEAVRRIREKDGSVVLDVRRKDEFAEGHLPRAILLTLEPKDEITPNIAKTVPDKATPILVYCKGGGRSLKATRLLLDLGYGNVMNIGGYDQWPYEKNIPAETARKNLRANQGIVLLDVRRPDEFAAGYIPGARLLTSEPVDEVTPGIAALVPDKDTTIYVYCKGGGRSAKATRLLRSLGYGNAMDMGGYDQWPFEKFIPARLPEGAGKLLTK